MAELERTYKCLNPAGIAPEVELFPLAPRLDSLDGKQIVFSITGEPDITIPLEKRLKADYPNVNWKTKRNLNIDPNRLTEEEMKTVDGLIQAICW